LNRNFDGIGTPGNAVFRGKTGIASQMIAFEVAIGYIFALNRMFRTGPPIVPKRTIGVQADGKKTVQDAA